MHYLQKQGVNIVSFCPPIQVPSSLPGVLQTDFFSPKNCPIIGLKTSPGQDLATQITLSLAPHADAQVKTHTATFMASLLVVVKT
jgi:hypothetical protein